MLLLHLAPHATQHRDGEGLRPTMAQSERPRRRNARWVWDHVTYAAPGGLDLETDVSATALIGLPAHQNARPICAGPMNSIPAASNAVLMVTNVEVRLGGIRPPPQSG